MMRAEAIGVPWMQSTDFDMMKFPSLFFPALPLPTCLDGGRHSLSAGGRRRKPTLTDAIKRKADARKRLPVRTACFVN
jgi:hypothetical protein